jgi:serine/threonine protein kinase
MAKIYGGRWELVESVNSGGQGDIFRVRDIRGLENGDLVLKRVRNPRRRDRFLNEVAAIKTLNHQNVVRLIDHSALDAEPDVSEKQFLVMPFAAQGDLTKRRQLYTKNIDATLKVAKSLAEGLKAAHDQEIIHRDVKPANILFPDVSHDVWLADFGICLIRDAARSTLDDEAVGPIQFMAPELEAGGKLDISPAADVYSLGKVIYYMLSGGVVLPRERLHEEGFGKIFNGGEQYTLLQALLSRMICAPKGRIETMDGVLAEIERIRAWQQTARSLPFGGGALKGLSDLRKKSSEADRKRETNEEIRQRRLDLERIATQGTIGWVESELQKAVAFLTAEDFATAGLNIKEESRSDDLKFGQFIPGRGIELWVNLKNATYRIEHRLALYVSKRFRVSHSSSVSNDGITSVILPPDEPEFSELILLPVYKKIHAGANSKHNWNFIDRQGKLYSGDSDNGAHGLKRRDRLYNSGITEIMAHTFSTKDWPAGTENLPALITRLLDFLVEQLKNDRPF